jgi:PadR family transcriptional regulator, regulatory protein PadR
MTMPTLAVLDTITTRHNHGEQAWGLQICRTTGLGAGTVYPILKRLKKAGWVNAEWEATHASGRPRRRLYKLTSTGRAFYDEAVIRRVARGKNQVLPAGWYSEQL